MDPRQIIEFIRKTYKQEKEFIPLHAPYFNGNEKKYVTDTIDSTFVSSVGAYVNRFEEMLCSFTGARYAIAMVNGTTALQLGLIVSGLQHGEEVITQPLTFVATANAITHAGGIPVFIDVDKDTMGLSPAALQRFLENNTYQDDNGHCINKNSGKRIAACIPMHTFGFATRIDKISRLCRQHNIALVEDAAESIGSYFNDKHTGNFGTLGTFSFNGNKTITCGGGGAIITNDEAIARHAKHLSTTAKVAHPWEFVHDEVGYNFRMPNLNAAVACAQMEQLDGILTNKKELADIYQDFFSNTNIRFMTGLPGTKPNFWLNTIIFPDRQAREEFLRQSNGQGVMTRPAWQLMSKLKIYDTCEKGTLENASWLEDRMVNIPSSIRTA